MFVGDSLDPHTSTRRDYASDLLLPTQALTSLTNSLNEVESWRKKQAMIFIAFIVVLQNIADFSISVNMAWMAAVVGNGTCGWLQCKQPDIGTINHIRFNLSSTLEGALATLLYYILIAAFSVVGGYLGDAKIGRYKSIQVSLFFTIFGSALYLILSIILQHQAHHYLESILTDTGFFILTVLLLLCGLVMSAVGAGLHNANIIPFGAEQLSYNIEDNTEYIFYGFYFFRNVGCFITNLFVALLQQYRSWIGFSVPLISSILSIIPLCMGKRYFIMHFPRSMVTERLFKIIHEGYKFSKVPVAGATNSSRIAVVDKLDFAKEEFGGNYPSAEVNSVKAVVKLVPLLSVYIIYFTIYSQMHSTFYIQGLFIKTPHYFPYAGAEIANNLTILILLPLFLLVIYPRFEKKYGVFHSFSKIQIGFFFAAMAMISAGFVEYVRIHYLDPSYKRASLDTISAIYFHTERDVIVLQVLDVWVRFPQYFLIALSEIFAVVIGIEFAYREGPRTMRSITMGIFFMYNALGTFLSAILMLSVQITTLYIGAGNGWICQDYNFGKMYYFFFLLAGLMIFNMVCFIFRSKQYERAVIM